ncbi:MAG: alanine--tRNA ligase-related protein, partial [Candidatus Paceibacterota bacterium]
MKLNDVRTKYLKFFKSKGHKIIPSASLIPENDSTTLFTGSGMQPLVPYLLGQKHSAGTRLADSQKCFRSEDIEEVGDNRHTTFFEMLGNWSLGDYWKEEQLSYLYEFLVKEIKLDSRRLWVSCFEGDKKLGLPKDTESAEIWRKLGIEDSHIRFYGATKNWWSRSGVPENMPAGEPGGPDSEVFFDFDPDDEKGTHAGSQWKADKCHQNCDCGRFMEIGNSVFMEYQKQADGSFKKLAQRNVDFGGGLERITAATNYDPDILTGSVFEQDGLSVVRAITSVLGDDLRSLRIIADHLRSAIFLIVDGVLPS